MGSSAGTICRSDLVIEPSAEIRRQLLARVEAVSETGYQIRDLADRIFVPYILGEEVASSAHLCELAERITREALGGMAAHAYGMSIRAINMVGRRMPADVRLPEHSFASSRMAEWIGRLDWARPWRTSIHVLHAVMPGFLSGDLETDAVLAAIERFQSSSGGWGDAPLHHQIAAAFHLVPLYSAARTTMPRLDRLAHSVLTSEPVGAGFGAMDALYLLWYAASLGVVHRETISLSRYAPLAIPSEHTSLHELVACAQIHALVQMLLGEHGYRDAWDLKLWWAA